MFGLNEAYVGQRILGCGNGPASFSAEMSRNAHAVVSVYPLLQIGGVQPPFVQGVVETFVSQSIEASVERVAYEFQRCGNQLLRLRRTPPA